MFLHSENSKIPKIDNCLFPLYSLQSLYSLYSFMKNIHIIGFAGTEGAALLNYLYQKYPKGQLTAHNFCPEQQFLKHFRTAHIALGKQESLEAGKAILDLETVEYRFEDRYLEGLEEAETIFVPQSWYLYPENEGLKKFKDKFRSITRLYFDLFPGKIIGVTGSNGKTTTTNLIADIMKAAYPSTLFSGNDRRSSQVLDQIENADENDWLVLEISNRQLMVDLGKSPDISIITNITPNHLNEYKSFAEYAKGKASMLQYQTEDQWSVLNQDDTESRKLMEIDGGETMPFSTEEELSRGVFEHFGNIIIKHADKEEVVMPVSDFPLKGKHNLSNALAAVAACYLADVPVEQIAQSLRSVEAIPQRMELIDTQNGIEYYNDSASTVPESTIAAIESLKTEDNQLFLIAGGRSKGSDYQPLADSIQEHVTQTFLLKSPLDEELKLADAVSCETLQEAVEQAAAQAKDGDVILFSPAAEYFVYFKDKMPDYKQFRHIVSKLA
jgi:UDP-N-acetylmuramoylalanine--D-glutamate ligase